MAEFKILSATPSSIGGRVLSNSDIARLASSIKGKVNVTPKPDYKPAPFEVTAPVEEQPAVQEPEPAKTIEAEFVEPVAEEQTPVVEEPVVVETELELDEANQEVEEPAEEPAGTDISVLGLSAANEKNLRNNNLTTVEALEAFVNENELESLPKIGVKAQEAILEALIKWQDEQKQN